MKLATIARNIDRSQKRSESADILETIRDLRNDTAQYLRVKQDAGADAARTGPLESLVAKSYEALQKTESACVALSEANELMDQELIAKECECEGLRQQVAQAQAERAADLAAHYASSMQDKQVMGDIRSEHSRIEAQLAAAQNACRIAEVNYANERARCDALLQMMRTEDDAEAPEIHAPAGWNMDVMRDGADKIMRVSLTPKE